MLSSLAVLIAAAGLGVLCPPPANSWTSERIAKSSRGSGSPMLAPARLEDELERWARIARRGGWPDVPDGVDLRLGDTGPRVAALRARLVALGDLPGSALLVPADAPYDLQLMRAIRRFQERHAIPVTGAFDKETARELAVPMEERARQLVVNLRRMRWLAQREFGDRHILVNLPSFEVTLYERGERVDRMRAVIGTTDRQTPLLFGAVKHLEVNPSWWVPPRIARERILPHAIRDPGWLRRRGYELRAGGSRVDPAEVDWESVRQNGRFPYAVRQAPGPGNAMGRVKFMFPNDKMIFLHDTPARAAFDAPRRDFSHGCVRVDRPARLAEFVLAGLTEEDVSLLTATIRGEGFRGTRKVYVPESVLVHLVYVSAWVDEDGVLQLRPDVYGRDADMARMLDEACPGWDVLRPPHLREQRRATDDLWSRMEDERAP